MGNQIKQILFSYSCYSTDKLSIITYLLYFIVLMAFKKQRTKYQEHPSVKIYFLRNDPNQVPELANTTKQTKRPTLSYLSSLIQYDKDTVASEMPSNDYQSHERNGLMEGIHRQKYDQLVLNQVLSKRANIISQTEAHQHNTKNTFTTSLLPNTRPNHLHLNSQRAHLDIHSKNLPRRMIKTSQQQKYPALKQNNEVLSKDFLCNIVKEWNTFSERDQMSNRRSQIKKWKRSIDTYHKKSQRHEDGEELRRNKTLMKEDFDMFIEHQKTRGQKKKKTNPTLLKAVFKRQHSQRSILNRNLKAKNIDQSLQSRVRERKKNLSVDENLVLGRQQKISGGERVSSNEKSTKDKYLRLLYGPEVRMIPRLFEERTKAVNFDWTKLDKEQFNVKRKITHL